jgi:integrase
LLAEYRREKLLSSPATTLYEYARAVRIFAKFLKRPATVRDLNKPKLLEFREWRIAAGQQQRRGHVYGKFPYRPNTKNGKPPKAKPLSVASVNKDLRVLAALARFAFDEMLIEAPPRKVSRLTEPKREPQGYSIDDIAKLLRACAETPGKIGGVPAALFWWTFFAATYDTGLRRTVLLGRSWSDLNFQTGRINANAEDQKQNADQTRELSEETLDALRNLRKYNKRLIWHFPHCDNTFYRRTRKIIARAELSRLPRKPVHGLRCSHATYIYEKFGLDAARDACGHSTSLVTQRYYIDKTLLSNQPGAISLPRPEALPVRRPQDCARTWRIA